MALPVDDPATARFGYPDFPPPGPLGIVWQTGGRPETVMFPESGRLVLRVPGR